MYRLPFNIIPVINSWDLSLIRYLLFFILYSLLVILYSLFVILYSLFFIRSLSFISYPLYITVLISSPLSWRKDNIASKVLYRSIIDASNFYISNTFSSNSTFFLFLMKKTACLIWIIIATKTDLHQIIAILLFLMNHNSFPNSQKQQKW